MQIKSNFLSFIFIFVLLALLGCPSAPPQAFKRVIGYYDGSSTYKKNYQVTDIPAQKLTHIVYAFLQVGPDFKVMQKDKFGETEKSFPNNPSAKIGYKGTFGQLYYIRQKYPNVRVIFSINTTNYSPLAASSSHRKAFVASVIEFIRQYHFDGVDIDWEFPVEGGAPEVETSPADGGNFTKLLKDLRLALDTAAKEDKCYYELSAAVGPNPLCYRHYELAELAKIVDYLGLMTYDFHGLWDKTTNHIAPLYASQEDPAQKWAGNRKFNVDAAVKGFIAGGFPAEKLVLGIPAYGVAWQIAPGAKRLYQPVIEPATTSEIGRYDYTSVNRLVAEGHAVYQLDDISKAAYVYKKDPGLFISYDSKESVGIKTQYMLDNDLGGMMIWQLAQDRDGDLLDTIDGALKKTKANEQNPYPQKITDKE